MKPCQVSYNFPVDVVLNFVRVFLPDKKNSATNDRVGLKTAKIPKFVSAKFQKRITAASLFFQIWVGTFINIIYYNAFDSKIMSIGLSLTWEVSILANYYQIKMKFWALFDAFLKH